MDAEKIAWTLPHGEFVTRDSVPYELYGVTEWLVDREAARRALGRRGVPSSRHDELAGILDERVETLNFQERLGAIRT